LKSLEWYIPSKFITCEEQIKSCLISAIWELAFHLDEITHFLMVRDLKKLVSDEYCGGVDFDTPSWGEIIDKTMFR
jgi:hypothetical protein